LAAARLAEALRRQGISVWWDPDIRPGEVWDALIERKLAAAPAVVVLWSGTSITRSWVKAEAADALERGILVPVFIEDVKPPLAFRQIQAARLSDWRGEREHCGFQHLLCTVCQYLERGSAPICGPRQPGSARLPGAEAEATDDISFGTPVACATGPSPAQAILPTPIPRISPRQNAAIVAPQLPTRRSGTRRNAARIAGLVLLGTALGYVLHEGLGFLFGGS
jgi:hypothetical protein